MPIGNINNQLILLLHQFTELHCTQSIIKTTFTFKVLSGYRQLDIEPDLVDLIHTPVTVGCNLKNMDFEYFLEKSVVYLDVFTVICELYFRVANNSNSDKI